MRGFRLLVCVDTSRAALQAARLAVRMVGDHGGVVRAVSVAADEDTVRMLDARGRQERPAGERFAEGLRAVLDRITKLAEADAVPVETAVLSGAPLRSILSDAERWRPDIVVIGRTGRSGPGSPMVGSLAMHLVEFTEWPVMVVPAPRS